MSEAAVPSSGPINANAVGAVIILAVLGITIVPLPPAALDVLLALSISISVLVFMVALYVERPLEFSAFPSLLLLVTLFRLALNIATTRSRSSVRYSARPSSTSCSQPGLRKWARQYWFAAPIG